MERNNFANSKQTSRLELLAAFNSVETPDDAFTVWSHHLEQLADATLILSTLGESPFGKKLQSRFGDTAQLISGFADINFFFLNSHIYQQFLEGRETPVQLSYLVCFDSNAASHLRGLCLGAESQAISDLKKLLSHFHGNRLNWQILPYLLESSLSDNPKTSNAVFETVLAIEKLKDIDTNYFASTGNFKQLSNDHELTARAQKRVSRFRSVPDVHIRDNFIQIWRLTYVCILKCALLELQLPGSQMAAVKMSHLIKFMAHDLQCMMMTILKIAWIWFAGFEEGLIFKPVQRGNPKLLKKLKNISWDIYHLLRLPQESLQPARPGVFLIPYFLTFDDALSRLMKVCGLRLCLLEKEFCYPYCVQATTAEPIIHFLAASDKSLAEIFTEEAAALRKPSSAAKIAQLFETLETELAEYQNP